jgi:hypothetical protein
VVLGAIARHGGHVAAPIAMDAQASSAVCEAGSFERASSGCSSK